MQTSKSLCSESMNEKTDSLLGPCHSYDVMLELPPVPKSGLIAIIVTDMPDTGCWGENHAGHWHKTHRAD